MCPCDPRVRGRSFSSPGKLLASLSVLFADHADHHVVLSRFCELADQYHDEHCMSIGKAVSHAHTGVLFEYGDGGCDG